MLRLSFFVAALGLLVAVPRAQAQKANRVANYYTGTPNTASYEHFSFWTTDGRRGDMQYSHGADRLDVALRYAGAAQLQGHAAFKVRFPDGKLLYVAPADTTLLVAPTATAEPQVFRWEYEGPVNGVGTDCSVCAPDAAVAAELVRKHFVR